MCFALSFVLRSISLRRELPVSLARKWMHAMTGQLESHCCAVEHIWWLSRWAPLSNAVLLSACFVRCSVERVYRLLCCGAFKSIFWGAKARSRLRWDTEVQDSRNQVDDAMRTLEWTKKNCRRPSHCPKHNRHKIQGWSRAKQNKRLLIDLDQNLKGVFSLIWSQFWTKIWRAIFSKHKTYREKNYKRSAFLSNPVATIVLIVEQNFGLWVGL